MCSQVQRPGLKALFDIDLKNLKALAQWLDKGDETRDFVSIWAECADVLYREVRFTCLCACVARKQAAGL